MTTKKNSSGIGAKKEIREAISPGFVSLGTMIPMFLPVTVLSNFHSNSVLFSVLSIFVQGIVRLGNSYLRKSVVNFKLNFGSDNEGLDKIEIINAAGYLIANLNVDSQDEKFTWNGKTLNEKLAPSGIYFVRFKWASNYKTQKFVLLR